MNRKNLRIVFMGTPEFAVESLKILLENNKNIVGVITAPDKPAGRGKKINTSAVKDFAEKQQLQILQPTNLKSVEFHEQLKELHADLQIVVAFRMLPESVWDNPDLGTFNLHASLLPNYRGAAPINRAIMNGETETGVTTFFLQKDIDTGDIIFQEKVQIGPDESAGELHDRLMKIGAELVLKTVEAIERNEINSKPQQELINSGMLIQEAPKIFKEDCKIDWNRSMGEVHNFIRGLSPYPAAWTELKELDAENRLTVKIYKTQKEITESPVPYGQLVVQDKKVKIGFKNGNLVIEELQLAGKKKMSAKELLNGTDLSKYQLPQ